MGGTLDLMGHTLYLTSWGLWDLSLVKNLEAKRGGVITGSSGKGGLTSQAGIGGLFSWQSWPCRIAVPRPQFHWDISMHAPSNFQDPIPSQSVLHLIANTKHHTRLRLQFAFLFSHSQDEILCLVYRNLSLKIHGK